MICTNLANLTDDILLYLRDEGIKISTSLDGPAFIHNVNRPRPGNNSYELTTEKYQACSIFLYCQFVTVVARTRTADVVDECRAMPSDVDILNALVAE